MANILLPLQAGTIADNCFPPTMQELLVKITENATAVLENGMAFYNYGNTKPAPEFQIYPWLNTNDMRWYRNEGDWIADNPEVPWPNIVRKFVTGAPGTIAADISTYDGGDALAPSDRSGPMWEIDTTMTGRLAIGAGAIPGRTIAPTTLVSGDTIGAGEHTQIAAEVGPHAHQLPVGVLTYSIAPGQKADSEKNSFNYQQPPMTDSNLVPPAVTAPMDIMPPVLAGYWLKRTSRRFYRVP